MTYIGIDPGLSGAVAWLHGIVGVAQPQVADMPTTTTHKGKSVRHHYDIKALVALLRPWAGVGTTAYLERQQAMPGQGVTSMFSIGYGFGLIEGLLVALGMPYVVVSPQTWQKAMLAGTSGTTKERALTVARRLFPHADLGRRKDAGRADALLIAEWGRRQGEAESRQLWPPDTTTPTSPGPRSRLEGIEVTTAPDGAKEAP